MQRIGEDGQAQGLRIVAEAVYDLAAIRKRYAKGLRLACNGGADAARLAELLEPFRNGSCRSSSSTATTASAASSSSPTTGASTSTTR